MEILVINKNNIGNYKAITDKKNNIIFLENQKNYKSIIKEYMPEYIILSENIKDFKKIQNYILNKTNSQLVITGKNLIKLNDFEIKENNENQAVINSIKIIQEYEDKLKLNFNKILNQQVTSIFSVQGGSGKTTLAFNIGYFLSKLRKINVLIIDLNFSEGPGDLATNLELPGVPNLDIFIENISDSPKSIWDSIINIGKNLDLLQPPYNLEQSDKLTIDMLDELIFSARKKYNYIICDLPNNYNNIIFEALNLSTKVIFVLYPQAGAIKRANNFMKFLTDEQDILTVFNKVDLDKEKIDYLKNSLDVNVSKNIPLIQNNRNLYGFVNLQEQVADLKNGLI